MDYYNQADQQFHILAQLLARTNKAFQREKQDDSHTNMHFDSDAHYLVGRRMMIPDSGIQFYPAIDLETTEFITLRLTGEKEIAFKIAGMTMDQAKRRLSEFWREKGLDTLSFEQAMHYEIPDYSFATKKISLLKREIRDEWTTVRSKANSILSAFSGETTLHSLVRIWPHHFDTGFYHQCEENKGIGVGFAMKDTISSSPYFYISAFENDEFIAFTSPPKNGLGQGLWKTEGNWKGAYFPITHSTFETEEVQEWMKKTYNYFKKSLGLKLLVKTDS